MSYKKTDYPMYYLAVLMPKTGRGANKVRYYKASRDLRRMLTVEKQLNPNGWKQALLESLLVVPKRRYKYPFGKPEKTFRASLAKVVGITTYRPKFIITTSKSQFVLANSWTSQEDSQHYLSFVQHDYNASTKAKIAVDWAGWRQEDERQFASKLYQTIQQAI
ncbi:hypothetical protein LNP18_06210 [Leuconostoc citreum]|uniref:DUF7679 family protein n=1 Tax=Leuconostoc citreum TaxID=33964 RepID=UPI00200B439A|nr:hypothetical protein [Leuconostoc citreum]MCK8605696.1 hypothetical protein [Leuconostoc citreum]